MPRAPFQVLVIPFIRNDDGTIEYGLLKRDASTGGYWQFVAGGGEEGEKPYDAARRESAEEIGTATDTALVKLDSMNMIPVVDVCGFKWGPDVLVIPEHCFAVELHTEEFTLSNEHTEYKWLPYDKARTMLKWESNKTALWELDHRLTCRK